MNIRIAAGILSLSMLPSTVIGLEIIGQETGVNKDATQYHQFNQGVTVYDLSNREGIVEVVNKGIEISGGSGRLNDRALAREPVASFYRGLMHLFGVNTPVSTKTGLMLIETAYQTGTPGTIEQREAALLLSDIYGGYRVLSTDNHMPLVVDQEQKDRSTVMVHEAGLAGHPLAAKRLAGYYWSGENGLPRDRDLGMYWISRSAGMGDKDAMNTWEQWQEDIRQSSEYVALREEASRGQATALLELAKMYYAGSGVAQDKVRGYHLAKQASLLGVNEANYYLKTWLTK